MKIEKLEIGKYVQWRCIQSNMQNTDAWKDTVLRFDIESQSAGCTLRFEQIGYKDSPWFNECNPGWRFVLGKSLKDYLESGRGSPYCS